METSLDFVAGQGTKFIIDGQFVEIQTDDKPVCRIPFSDLLEFANNHPLQANSAISGKPSMGSRSWKI